MQSCSEGVSTSKRNDGDGPLKTVIHIVKKKRPLGDNKVEYPGTSKVQKLMELLPNKAQKAKQLKNDQHVLEERAAKTKKEAEVRLQEFEKRKQEEFAKAYEENVKKKKEVLEKAENTLKELKRKKKEDETKRQQEVLEKAQNTLKELKREKKEDETKRQQEVHKLEMEKKKKLQRMRDDRVINNKRMREEAREHSPRSVGHVQKAKLLMAQIHYEQYCIDEHEHDQAASKLSKERKMELIRKDLDKKIFSNLSQNQKDKDLIEERQEDQKKKKEGQEKKNKEESKERNDFKTAKAIKKKEDERRDQFKKDERRKKEGDLLGKDERRKKASKNGVQIPKSTPKQDINAQNLAVYKLIESNQAEFNRYNAAQRVSPDTYDKLTRSERADCIPMNTVFQEYLKYRKEYLTNLQDDFTTEAQDAYTYIWVS